MHKSETLFSSTIFRISLGDHAVNLSLLEHSSQVSLPAYSLLYARLFDRTAHSLSQWISTPLMVDGEPLFGPWIALAWFFVDRSLNTHDTVASVVSLGKQTTQLNYARQCWSASVLWLYVCCQRQFGSDSQAKSTRRWLSTIWFSSFFPCRKRCTCCLQKQKRTRKGQSLRQFQPGSRNVNSKKVVILEAQRDKKKVHFATLMDICHLKNVELEPNIWEVKRSSRAPRWYCRTPTQALMPFSQSKVRLRHKWQ